MSDADIFQFPFFPFPYFPPGGTLLEADKEARRLISARVTSRAALHRRAKTTAPPVTGPQAATGERGVEHRPSWRASAGPLSVAQLIEGAMRS
jgi:hypothetical protein